MPKEMYLCRQDGSHKAIFLPDGVEIIIGRGPLTEIKDQKLSRNQLKLKANYSENEIIVEQLGPNPSTVDGKALVQNRTRRISDGSHLCLLYNKYVYNVRFNSGKPDVDSTAVLNTPESKRPQAQIANLAPPRMKSVKRTVEESEKSIGGESKKLKVSGEDLEKSENCLSEEEDNEEKRVLEAEEKLGEMRRVLAKDKSPSSSGMKRSISLPISAAAAASANGSGKMGLPQVPGDQWEEFGKLVVYTCRGAIPREKIAGFDIDWTIIATKSGKVFPVGNDDWRILYSEVVKKLRQLFEDDYKIVFFSNQRGLVGQSLNDFKKKVLNIIAKIGVPVQVFVAVGSGIYRKPAPGMWNHLVNVGNEGLSIDVRSSFYVGDAAGRPANWGPKKKKDFACGDRLFALNNGLKFYTPEEFFLNEKSAPFVLSDFDPRTLNSDASLTLPPNATIISKNQEMIVMVGYPASGKSHFVQTYLVPAGYVHINRDLLGSWQKCISVAQTALKQRKSVVIDNTNPDPSSRKRFCECSQAARVPARCFIMNVSLGHAKHNNKFRLLNDPDEEHRNVNDIILNSFRAKYEEPKLNEGFMDIIRVNFIPKFDNEKVEKLYRMFLMEK
ncbi:hypothetical protein CHUAL_011726 [Chamberlinius hualienensis]